MLLLFLIFIDIGNFVLFLTLVFLNKKCSQYAIGLSHDVTDTLKLICSSIPFNQCMKQRNGFHLVGATTSQMARRSERITERPQNCCVGNTAETDGVRGGVISP